MQSFVSTNAIYNTKMHWLIFMKFGKYKYTLRIEVNNFIILQLFELTVVHDDVYLFENLILLPFKYILKSNDGSSIYKN